MVDEVCPLDPSTASSDETPEVKDVCVCLDAQHVTGRVGRLLLCHDKENENIKVPIPSKGN